MSTSAKASESKGNIQKKILVVDDDPSLRELLCRSLSRHGFHIDQACDGQEAFSKFCQTSPLQADLSEQRLDVVVTDYLMPKMDGAELVRRIKAIQPEFPVVLVTGEAPDAVILELASFSNVITLIKPFRPEVLFGAVRLVLERSLSDGRQTRRKSLRVDVSISCIFFETHQTEQEAKFATVRNLSFGGCFIQLDPTDSTLPIGAKIRFSFQGLEHYALAGEVAWIESSGMGVSLKPETSESDAFFKKFVLNKLKQKGVGIMGAQPMTGEAAPDASEST
jgi:DNA-binding response OmpR family regulator